MNIFILHGAESFFACVSPSKDLKRSYFVTDSKGRISAHSCLTKFGVDLYRNRATDLSSPKAGSEGHDLQVQRRSASRCTTREASPARSCDAAWSELSQEAELFLGRLCGPTQTHP